MEIGIKFVMTHLEIKKTNLPGFLNDFHIQTLIFFFSLFLSLFSPVFHQANSFVYLWFRTDKCPAPPKNDCGVGLVTDFP